MRPVREPLLSLSRVSHAASHRDKVADCRSNIAEVRLGKFTSDGRVERQSARFGNPNIGNRSIVRYICRGIGPMTGFEASTQRAGKWNVH